MPERSLKFLCFAFLFTTVATTRVSPKRSDDVDVTALQNVVQQQSALIQTLQSQLTAMENSMQSLRTKLTAVESQLQQNVSTLENSFLQQSAVTRTLESRLTHNVAFTCTGSTHSFDIGQNGVVPFHNVITNVGGGYNANTGIFTAPIAGTYGFFFNIRSDNLHTYIVVQLQKNGHVLVSIAVEAGQDVRLDKGTGFAITYLEVGDNVLVRHISGTTFLEVGSYTTFSGFLLLAD